MPNVDQRVFLSGFVFLLGFVKLEPSAHLEGDTDKVLIRIKRESPQPQTQKILKTHSAVFTLFHQLNFVLFASGCVQRIHVSNRHFFLQIKQINKQINGR